MTLKYNEVMRQCRYNYTQDERLEKADALAREHSARNATNNDIERIKKDYKAREALHEAAIEKLVDQLNSGYEMREYLCHYTYDDPKPGRKTLRRCDTGEVVAEEDMTGKDTQMVMEKLDAEAAQDMAAEAAGETDETRRADEAVDAGR